MTAIWSGYTFWYCVYTISYTLCNVLLPSMENRNDPLFLLLQKWKKVWGVLYGTTPTGLARLELYEGIQPPEIGRKQECWKLLQLSECVSLSERSNESSPKDTRVFSIETTQRVYLIASEASEQPNWVKALCSLAFPQVRRKPNKYVKMAEHRQHAAFSFLICTFVLSVCTLIVLVVSSENEVHS